MVDIYTVELEHVFRRESSFYCILLAIDSCIYFQNPTKGEKAGACCKGAEIKNASFCSPCPLLRRVTHPPQQRAITHIVCNSSINDQCKIGIKTVKQ